MHALSGGPWLVSTLECEQCRPFKWAREVKRGQGEAENSTQELRAAAGTGDIEALKAVFDSCDLNARGGVFKQTALAFVDCPDDLTRWLVEQGADLSAADSYGETPLHARAGHWKGNVDLLIELGADVNDDANGRGRRFIARPPSATLALRRPC